ncbi:HpcH/HpaI aldolase/citrate lyase family protein [Tropicimonas sp.]|uniref:HpcH/HpaI aldolase/citrate lyase family protein n=1 Tax=Tropicimonas sp. TaxID=2067044 RepID=UPI003A8B3AAD
MTDHHDEIALAQTLLFVPANRPERFGKAAGSGADAVIVDLEDAVAPADKSSARDSLDDLSEDLAVILRINAADSEWYAADIARALSLNVAAVMLPKAKAGAELVECCASLGEIPVIALIESAAGLATARQVAATPGVLRLAFGSVDYCADLGCTHLRDVLLPARAELVLSSRLGGIAAPIDGVTTEIRDMQAVTEDARHARDLGMGGKLAIHPSQIAPIVAAFRPSPDEVAWAKRVLAAGEGGAVMIDGAMVDLPVRLRARKILASAKAE